ncbi:hypothetical protein ACSAZK_01280 [Methanosarcina sp. Mfa9]|uniref:hypothetical protein n=1 Tax=Methanosarcina sp. Mfa9 TaxID=3439063 RepID=UPI003F8774E5
MYRSSELDLLRLRDISANYGGIDLAAPNIIFDTLATMGAFSLGTRNLAALGSPFEAISGIIVLLSLLYIIHDLLKYNKEPGPWKRLFWISAALVFGLPGVFVYYLFGRKQAEASFQNQTD